MRNARKTVITSLLKGFFVAVLVTFAAMLLLAAGLIYLQISDRLLFTLNQVTKIVSVFCGVCAAVPRGGKNGFVTGVVVALFYAVIGTVLYTLLGGSGVGVTDALGEGTVCAAVGAITGAVRANLAPNRRPKAA